MHSGDKLKVIDLFAGAGGLSKGFEQTGVFEIVLAVEAHKQYRATYERNHQNVEVLGDINEILDSDQFDSRIRALRNKYGSIDVVMGGPPCQGFSKANRQRNRLISTNNLLALSFMKFVQRVKPRAFVMENVSDMPGYNFFVSTDEWGQEALKQSAVRIETETITLGNVGKDAAELSNHLKGFLSKNTVTELYWADTVNSCYPKMRTLNNYLRRSQYHKAERFIRRNHRELLLLAETVSSRRDLPPSVQNTVDTVLHELANGRVSIHDVDFADRIAKATAFLSIMSQYDELQKNRIKVLGIEDREGKIVVKLQSYNLAEHLVSYFEAQEYITAYKVLEAAQYGVPQHRRRVFFIGVQQKELQGRRIQFPKPLFDDESEFYTVRDALSDLEHLEPVVEVISTGLPRPHVSNVPPLAKYLMGQTSEVFNHIRTSTREAAQRRYQALEPGQNFHDLPNDLIATYSDPRRTQKNIYLRLMYDAPAPTVTNVRKAMWVHPSLDRAISIREAARLQSFPDSYFFCGTKNDQYQQVGNAVPPFLAQAVGEAVAQMLGVPPKETLQKTLRMHPRWTDYQQVCNLALSVKRP